MVEDLVELNPRKADKTPVLRAHKTSADVVAEVQVALPGLFGLLEEFHTWPQVLLPSPKEERK